MSERAIVTSDLVLADRGGGNPRTIIGSGLICSWEVNAAGQLSTLAPLADVRAAGFGPDMRGKWLTYEHGSAGKWSGVVTASPATDGIVEIVAQGFETLLKKRLATVSEQTATPGALFRAAYADAANGGSTFLTLGSIDESGTPITASWTGEDFYDSVAPQLTIDAGYEWRVGHDRVITFARQLGVDRSASVEFAHGREVLSSRWTYDLFPLVNSIVATGIGKKRKKINRKGKKNKFKTSTYVAGPIRVVNQSSVDRFGLLEEERDYGFVGDEETLEQRALDDLNRLTSDMSDAVELTIADEARAFSKFIEGDKVSVGLGLSGVSGIMRVMVRTLDVQAGTMILAGLGAAN